MKIKGKVSRLVLFFWVVFAGTVNADQADAGHHQKVNDSPRTASLYLGVGSEYLGQAYLDQWFSIDSREPHSLKFRSSIGELDSHEACGKCELNFYSDDGQAVNGTIAFPKLKKTKAKLALLMHPMGIDQRFWWSEKSPLSAHLLTELLLQEGYTVLSLDARQHGKRSREGFGSRELLKRAHGDAPRIYTETIIGSVRDYRILLKWATDTYSPEEVLVMGYSMGAQMSLLLASFEPDVDRVVVMAPPFVSSSISPVAPRIHNSRINSAEVLWLAGLSDPYSDKENTQIAFDQLATSRKSLVWFDAGHRLPDEYLEEVSSFIKSPNFEGGK